MVFDSICVPARRQRLEFEWKSNRMGARSVWSDFFLTRESRFYLGQFGSLSSMARRWVLES